MIPRCQKMPIKIFSWPRKRVICLFFLYKFFCISCRLFGGWGDSDKSFISGGFLGHWRFDDPCHKFFHHFFSSPAAGNGSVQGPKGALWLVLGPPNLRVAFNVNNKPGSRPWSGWPKCTHGPWTIPLPAACNPVRRKKQQNNLGHET